MNKAVVYNLARTGQMLSMLYREEDNHRFCVALVMRYTLQCISTTGSKAYYREMSTS